MMPLILSPLAPYAILALSLIASLAMFVSMKVEIAKVRHYFMESRHSAQAATSALAEEMADLRREASPTETAPCAGQELNLTRRAQALRMQRRGESPATITAALRLPRNQVELLLKIEGLANGQRHP